MAGKKLTTKICLICALFLIIYVKGDAALKASFMQDLCHFRNETVIDMRNTTSGILLYDPKQTPEEFDCIVNLVPKPRSSVVLSIYRYELGPEDTLMIEDSDHYKFALTGSGDFPDERKAVMSAGRMVIRYHMVKTTFLFGPQRLQFTFTQVNDPPCRPDEFQCKNGKCIERKLACNGHNHCGDLGNQQNCVPKDMAENATQGPVIKITHQIAWTSIIGVVISVILFIVIIVLIALIIRQSRRKIPQSSVSDIRATPANSRPSRPAI